MLFAVLTIGSVVLGQSADFAPVKLEEFGPYRAMPILVNGQAQYAVVEPLNFESHASLEAEEEFGSRIQVKYAGQERDLEVKDTFWRSDEISRTVTDKRISLFMGTDFFEKRIVALDYWNETLQVFDSARVGDALTWLKAGSPDEEPTVIRVKLAKNELDDWVTDQFKYGLYKISLFPVLVTSDMDQRSGQEPLKWGELWDQGSPDGDGGYVKYTRGLWKDISFGGQVLPFFVGTWAKADEKLPGVEGSIAVRELGSRRLFYDSTKGEIWFCQSSATEHMGAVLSSEVFRFPVRLTGGALRIGRIPRFDDSVEDGLCSGGVITAVDSISGEELVKALGSGGDAQRAMVRDLVLRSRQRITVEVLCVDGKKRTIYVNSLLSGG
ncbi:MAG: hypothetical protein ACKVQS_02630 [Fimbriimonadaceae bacterium]